MEGVFHTAVLTVLKHEGGYVNDPKDPGGETNYGISKRAFPKEDIKRLTVERAIALYLKHYWQPARCGELPVALQPIHFDTAVNCGVVQAIRILQRAGGVEDDGVFGSATQAAAQKVTVQAYVRERLAYHDRIIARNPALERFRKGWTKRINSYVK